MSQSDNKILGDYLNKKLSKADEYTLRVRLESDESLKEEYERLALLKTIAERNRILEEVRQVHEQKIAELKTPKGSIISWSKISGFAAAACFVGVFYLGNADFNYLQLSSAERGNNNATTALTDLEKGLSLLQNDEPKTAIVYFQKAKDNTELTDYYRDAARWYEVVSYAEMDMDKEAKNSLKLIENSKSFKYKIGWIEQLKMTIRLIF